MAGARSSRPCDICWRHVQCHRGPTECGLGEGGGAAEVGFNRMFWGTLYTVKGLDALARFVEEGEDTGRHRPLGLRELLEMAASKGCRDPQDKVHGLLGMVDPGVATMVVQEVKKDGGHAARVFATLARSCISYYNNLEPLRHGNMHGKAGAPSWAADWTFGGRIRGSQVLSQEVQHAPSPDVIYSAAGAFPARFNFPGDGSQLLECDGFVFDQVVGLGNRPAGYFRWRTDSMVQPPSGWTWNTRAYGRGLRDVAVAVAHALMLGRRFDGSKTDERHLAVLSLPKRLYDLAGPQFKERGWDYMLSMSQDSSHDRWGHLAANDTLQLGEDVTLGDLFTDDIPPDAEEAVYREVWELFGRSSYERRLMVTARGYIGWGPHDTTRDFDSQFVVGDLICVLWGCSTPLLIHPATGSNRFHVVGEAYVHGVMDGEALALLESGECKATTFTFC